MEIKVYVLFANFESKYKCKPLGFTAALLECAYLRYQEIDANFYLEVRKIILTFDSSLLCILAIMPVDLG